MEASTLTTLDPPAVTKAGDAIQRLYRYSEWLHVGDGAGDCEHATDGDCSDGGHFHAWCRVANAYQDEDIRNKAKAAKARKARQLRDPESDAYVVLSDDIEQLAQQGDRVRDEVIEELVAKDFWQTYYEAERDVKDRVGDDETPVWEHIDDDRERLAALEAMEPSERPADEYGELTRRLAAFAAEIEAAFTAALAPLRDALGAKDISELLDLVRDQRIEVEAGREYINAQSVHTWLACAFRTEHGTVTVWEDFNDIYHAAPEVIVAVGACFSDLARSQREAAQGNS